MGTGTRKDEEEMHATWNASGCTCRLNSSPIPLLAEETTKTPSARVVLRPLLIRGSSGALGPGKGESTDPSSPSHGTLLLLLLLLLVRLRRILPVACGALAARASAAPLARGRDSALDKIMNSRNNKRHSCVDCKKLK